MKTVLDAGAMANSENPSLRIKQKGQEGVRRETQRPKLLYLVAEDHYFWTHRRCLATAAQDEGFDVTVVSRAASHANRIREAGFKLIPFRLHRDSLNPFREVLTLVRLVRLYRHVRPTLVHHVALKPMVLGTIAARLAGVARIVNSVAGLGGLSSPLGPRARWMALGASLALRMVRAGPNSVTIFQTDHDREVFNRSGFIATSRSIVIRGAGVDLDRFTFQPEVAPPDPPIVMLAARLLWNKGVRELVETGRRLRARGIPVRIVFVGVPDHESLQAVPAHQLEAWSRAGLAEWWGYQEDMPAILGMATVVVLPTTYGEGVPKILLEAGAVGRPVVTTDVPGCREIVGHGRNGLVVPTGDLAALESSLEELLQDPVRRAAMGLKGRACVESAFSDRNVAADTVAVYRDLIQREVVQSCSVTSADAEVRLTPYATTDVLQPENGPRRVSVGGQQQRQTPRGGACEYRQVEFKGRSSS